jgi:hypothetical protein
MVFAYLVLRAITANALRDWVGVSAGAGDVLAGGAWVCGKRVHKGLTDTISAEALTGKVKQSSRSVCHFISAFARSSPRAQVFRS